METLQVLWVEAEPAEATPFWVEQLAQANCPSLEVKTAASLGQALAAAPKISNWPDLDSQTLESKTLDGKILDSKTSGSQAFCIIWSGPEHLLWAELEALKQSAEFPQALEQALPIVLVSNDAICLDETLRALGVREVLYRPTLTRALLLQTLRYVAQLHQLEQKVRIANRRLCQSDQLLTRQSQLLANQSQHIQRLTVQVAEASQLKNQFLAMISHELRTPLNAIIGFSQLIGRNTESFNDRQRDMVRRITTNANRLLNLVENILTFTKIEAGQLVVQSQPVDLQQLLQAVIDEVQPAATQKGLCLRLQLTQPVQVATDPIYLQQIVFNLLTNAIKFTAAGSITVAVEQDANRTAILIRDTGIGMQLSDLQYIFEPFRQVDQSLSRQYQGAGLGLAVTASLVNQLQGKITVKSKQGKGSEFRVDLPQQFTQPSTMATCPSFRNSVA